MRRCLLILAIGTLLPVGLSQAQTSIYSSMTVAGEWQGWNPGANNLYLISNHVWEGVFFIGDRSANRFKFVPNGAWGTDWGAAVTSSIPLYGVLTGTANLTNVFGADITFTNVIEGYYRFRFHELSKVYEVRYLTPMYDGPAGGNLIRNGTFELADLGDNGLSFAWNYRPAMTYGGWWGNTGRRDWRYVSPFHLQYIGPAFGGIWQDAPGGRDFDYEASAWFWMDGSSNTNYGPWTASVQRLKIEFYGPQFGPLLAESSTNIPFVAENWNQVRFRAAAPSNAAWARVVVDVSGAGPKGSLQIDDVFMRPVPRPAQFFSSWTFNRTGTLVRGGWVATNAHMVAQTNLAYDPPSLALRNGGSIRSPRFDQGIGRVSFVYRTSFNDPNNDPTDNLSAEVRLSPDGVNFSAVALLINIANQNFQTFSVNINDPAQKYLEVRVLAGTNSLLLDNIQISESSPDLRFQDFSAWTNAAWTNAGFRELNGWQLNTGAMIYAGAFVAPSARLPGRSNQFNFIRSPLFSNGYGEISFQLARGSHGGAPAELHVQESIDGSVWTTIAGISNLSHISWEPYSLYFYQTQPRYVRLVNASTSTPSGTFSSLLIQEGFDSAPTAPPGWVFSGVGVYTTASSSGQSPPSIRFDDTGDFIETPSLVNPTNLQFWMRNQSLSGSYRFDVLGLVGSSWTTVQTFTAISGAATYTIPLSTNLSKLRFVYTLKASGNIALDDVAVQGVVFGGQPPQDLLIDDIEIGIPFESRTQDFEDWPEKSGYSNGVHIFRGWVITNAMVHPDNAYAGKSLRLNVGAGNFIVSPMLQDGIGVVSFRYAKWPSDTAPTLQLQYSTNAGVTWIVVTNITVANDAPSYLLFQRLLNVPGPASVRILHTAGAGRALIDEISIGYPQLPADVAVSGYHTPAAPFTNDAVRLWAVVSPVYGAQLTNMTAFFRVGTNGAFTPLAMAVTNFSEYQTTTTLGPYPTGTVVQYFIRAQFSGPGSEATSPRFFPPGGSNAPAFFAVPRAKPGQVWINEVRHAPDFENEFIELAGPALFNLSGWSIEIVTTSTGFLDTVQYKYVIPDGHALNTNAFPFGFWVLGTDDVPNRNMTLNDRIGAFYYFGIRLLNEGGGLEHAISIGGPISGFSQVPVYDDGWDQFESIGLTGMATNYAGFAWTNFPGGRTPGYANINQTFGSTPPTNLPPPDAWIQRIILGTNITVIAAGNSNAWNVAPFFTTSLEPAVWTPITPYNVTFSGGTNTIWFSLPAQTNWFLRLRYTHP
ncbi:MAG: hypothetical protein NZ740_00595 [Kiritimatiellae bacterium]|nr:hypothetical protein [Kiritimatiellia bacterium]MDW8457588.1 hypothetical protein [Verrucomicrobiota bacterium]